MFGFAPNPWAEADIARVERRRQADHWAVDPITGMRAPRQIGQLPDRGWDAFFGALQRKGEEAELAGKRFKVDLIGRGPGEGIGRFKAQTGSGPVVDLTEQATRGLTRAAGRRRGY